mgnify:CR=1 FL=1
MLPESASCGFVWASAGLPDGAGEPDSPQTVYCGGCLLRHYYQKRGLYPTTSAIEIRITGLDRPEDCALPGARAPRLSALRPTPAHPEWDTSVWFDLLVIPGTPHAFEFYRELEQWFYANYSGDYASVRVEWSKGWAYTAAGGHTSDETLGVRIPASFSAGISANADFRAAAKEDPSVFQEIATELAGW